MRSALVLSLAALATAASADRLITIPTGGKVPYGIARFESAWQLGRHDTSLNYLDVGITTAFDMDIRTEEFADRSTRGTFDLGYNVSAPIADLTPGISFGVLDAMNTTEDGRRAYAAMSYRTATIGNVAPGTSVEATIGASFGRKTKLFVGARLPFTDQFTLLAEHNGDTINAGFELKPAENLGLRLLFEGERTFASIRYTLKF